MPIKLALVVAGCLLLAAAARAQESGLPPAAVSDVVYKGVVGKALDAVPMDPDERVTLQRTSAVVSNTLTGRSLAAWAGLSNPILLIAGAVWGLISASHIKPAHAGSKPRARPGPATRIALIEPVETADPAADGRSQVALLAATAPTEGRDD